jgi:hypothetical protein
MLRQKWVSAFFRSSAELRRLFNCSPQTGLRALHRTKPSPKNDDGLARRSVVVGPPHFRCFNGTHNSPTLADKLAVNSKDGIERVVEKLLRTVN